MSGAIEYVVLFDVTVAAIASSGAYLIYPRDSQEYHDILIYENDYPTYE